jgi:hypothetical protein
VQTAFLRGRDHAALGAVAAVALGPLAITLSRGGAEKTYEYVDPNEDAACFAQGKRGALVAVADGHRGCEAAERALAELLAAHAPAWTGAAEFPADRWPAAARDALWQLHQALLRAAGELPGARTTLALALARFAEARLFWVSLGDSHVFRVRAGGAHDLAAAGRACPFGAFLGGAALDRAGLDQHAVAGDLPAAGTLALVVASDGVSAEQVGLEDPAGGLAQCAEQAGRAEPALRPLELARGLTELANATHLRRASGDNVAVGALWSGK